MRSNTGQPRSGIVFRIIWPCLISVICLEKLRTLSLCPMTLSEKKACSVGRKCVYAFNRWRDNKEISFKGPRGWGASVMKTVASIRRVEDIFRGKSADLLELPGVYAYWWSIQRRSHRRELAHCSEGAGGDNHWMNMRTNYDLTMASATVDVSDINPHFQFEIVEATID